MRIFERIAQERPLPQVLRTDNGPEFAPAAKLDKGGERLSWDDEVCKVSVVRVGIRSHAGFGLHLPPAERAALP